MKDQKKSPDVQKSTSNQPTTSGESIFIKQNDPVPRINEHLEFDDISSNDDSDNTVFHSQYRTNYPIKFDPHLLEDNFLKSLEG